MPKSISVGADVTPEFNDTIERIHGEHDDHGNKSDTVRFLMRLGAEQVDQSTFAEKVFKNLALGLAMVALVGYLWAALVAGYQRPLYVGVVWMIPAVGFLWLHELWPGIRARFGSAPDDTVNPSEA